MDQEIKNKSLITEANIKLLENICFEHRSDKPHHFNRNKASGFTKKQIEIILTNPKGNQTQLLTLSNYAYRSYAFFQQVVDYYSNMPLYRPMIYTIKRDSSIYQVDKIQLQKDHDKFVEIVNKMHLEWQINEIYKLMLLEDTVYGFWLEADSSNILYILPSEWCAIKGKLNNLYLYGINTKSVPKNDIEKLPDPIAKLIKSGNEDKDGYVYPEPVDSFVLKWNNQLTYNFPPLLSLLEPILNVKEYQNLEKVKAEQENYSLLSYEIPTGDGLDELKLTDKVVTPFMNMTKSIVPKSIGVTVNPLKLTPVSFKGAPNTDKDRVKNAIQNFYDESGISPVVMSGAGNSSQLKYSLLNDQMNIWRIYRQLESVISLHMDLLGVSTHPSYKFELKLLDITHYNVNDFINEYTSLAQTGYPVKEILGSAIGMPTNALLGTAYMENHVLGIDDIPLGVDWTSLKSSYTQNNSEGDRYTNENND